MRAHHSVWGVEAVKTGAFTPPALVGPIPFADLRAMIAQAEAALKAFTPEEVNGCSGKDLDLQIGPRRLEEDGKKTAFSICECMDLRIAPAS